MQEVACNNWAAEYPYAPRVRFAAGHDGKRLLLRFEVEEGCTMARVAEDNGPVWTDSAVEFFISFDERGYYNFEFNCIGRALLGFRKTKPEVRHADEEIMGLIVRRASLGGEPFEERRGIIDGRWRRRFRRGRSSRTISARWTGCGRGRMSTSAGMISRSRISCRGGRSARKNRISMCRNTSARWSSRCERRASRERETE